MNVVAVLHDGRHQSRGPCGKTDNANALQIQIPFTGTGANQSQGIGASTGSLAKGDGVWPLRGFQATQIKPGKLILIDFRS